MTAQPAHLRDANERKTRRSRRQVIDAVEELETEGKRLSVRAVAHRADVSRNFIYQHADLLEYIRSRPKSHPMLTPVRTRERATEESLRNRLVAAHDHIKRLQRELAEAQEQNARLLGRLREQRRS